MGARGPWLHVVTSNDMIIILAGGADMTAEKTPDLLTSEILRELSDLSPDDWEIILRSWKATQELQKRPGYEHAFVILQK